MTDADDAMTDHRSVRTRVRHSVRRLLTGIRTRTVTAVVAVLAVALGGTALGTRAVLQAQVDDRIDDQLRQEVEELRLFSQQGLDPATGEPFGEDSRRLLTVFVERSVPTRGETIVGYVEGEPVVRTLQEAPYEVADDPALSRRWSRADRTVRGRVVTPAGPFEYLAVPVRGPETQEAVLLVGSFRQVVAAEVDQTVAVTSLVALVALVLGVSVAAALARRILQPLAAMSRAAAGLGGADLSLRLGRTGADDELDDLASAFDAMLDRLESVFEDQRRFLDDAGHELRTPITVVRGHLETLGDDPGPAELDDTRRLVIDELDRMRRIVDDLLMLAQRDRPDFVQQVPFELDELTTSVLRRATALSDRHRWQLDVVGMGVVLGDEQRLAQAMLQLAGNAATHTPAGTTVAVGSSGEPGMVRLWVRDDGPGIPAQHAEAVFQRFTRVPGQSRGSEGAGLGLAIVAAVAEAHGGTVALERPPGGGARFELRIPQSGPGGPDDPADRAAAAVDAPSAPRSSAASDHPSTHPADDAGDPRRAPWHAS